MGPALESGEFCKFWLFWLILIVNEFWIVIIGLEDALGNYFETAGHSYKLSLEVMLLKPDELGRGEDLAFQMPSEVLLNLPCHFDMLGGDEWQLNPLCTDQIVGHPKSVVVDAFSSLLPALHSVLQCQHLPYHSLDNVVIQIAAKDLPPKPDLLHLVLLCQFHQMFINERNFLLRQRNSRPLQLLALQPKLLEDVPLFLHFSARLCQWHQHLLYIFLMMVLLWLRLLGQVGKMDDVLGGFGVLDGRKHAGQVRNDLRVLKQLILAAQLPCSLEKDSAYAQHLRLFYRSQYQNGPKPRDSQPLHLHNLRHLGRGQQERSPADRVGVPLQIAADGASGLRPHRRLPQHPPAAGRLQEEGAEPHEEQPHQPPRGQEVPGDRERTAPAVHRERGEGAGLPQELAGTCYFQYYHNQMKDYTNFAECSRICFGQIRTFSFRDWSRVMFCFYSLASLPKVGSVFLKARLFTYFFGNSWEMFSQSIVSLVCRAYGILGSMFDISASRFQQNSLRTRSLVSPPSIIRLEPFETIDVSDYRSALAVLSYRLLFAPLVSLSPALPFRPSLAYFSSSSSIAIAPLAILATVWMRS